MPGHRKGECRVDINTHEDTTCKPDCWRVGGVFVDPDVVEANVERFADLVRAIAKPHTSTRNRYAAVCGDLNAVLPMSSHAAGGQCFYYSMSGKCLARERACRQARPR